MNDKDYIWTMITCVTNIKTRVGICGLAIEMPAVTAGILYSSAWGLSATSTWKCNCLLKYTREAAGDGLSGWAPAMHTGKAGLSS